MYWLVNTGTTEEPWLDRLVDRYRAWNEEHGDVQMFSFRTRDLDVGDVLIHRLVGSPACELVAVGRVVKGPHPSEHERWPWQVGRRLEHVCETRRAAPSADALGIAARGLRVARRLSSDEGRRAEAAIVAAGGQFVQHPG